MAQASCIRMHSVHSQDVSVLADIDHRRAGGTHLMVDVTLAPSSTAPRNSQMAATTTTCITAPPECMLVYHELTSCAVNAQLCAVGLC
jgi:hypothetical protein